jgi:LysM repeat protein
MRGGISRDAAAKEIYPKEKVPYPLIGGTWVHSGWLTGGKYVTIQAWSVQLKVTGILGPEGMKITSGYGEWEEVRIPRGDPYSQWKGRPLFTATLDIILDGWGANPRSIETGCKNLDTLGQRIPGMVSPTNVRIWGPVPKAGLSWVITSIDYNDVIRDPRSGVRFRQQCLVHLLEYRAEETVAAMPRAKATPKPPQKYKVKKGDTLKSIAAKLLGNSNKWQLIEKKNKGLRGFQIPKSFIGKTILVPPK